MARRRPVWRSPSPCSESSIRTVGQGGRGQPRMDGLPGRPPRPEGGGGSFFGGRSGGETGMLRSLLDVPGRIRDSFHREPHTHRPRERPVRMIDNLFLHVHPNRVSSNSLKPATTLGLGLITICLFLVLTVTGL